MKLPPITVFLLPLDHSAILSNQPNSEAPEIDMQPQMQTQPVMIASNETAEDSGYQGKN